ncbi:PAS domain-containing protein [Azospirillum sp. ST 5-10]|uniref:PAS domain-containing protein n=1 Tax=unclassified Azospirillum TaxID=2630922 RepID=UPI003F4A2CF5
MAGRATLRQRLLLAWGLSSLLLVAALGTVFTTMLTGLHTERAKADIGVAFDLLSAQLRDDSRAVRAGALVLAGREEVIGALHLVSSFEDPTHYNPFIFDVEKRRLAETFADQARGIGLDLVTAHDAGLSLVAFYASGQPEARSPDSGFITVIGGHRVPVGTAQPLDRLARIVEPPAILDALAPAAVPGGTTLVRRLYGERLLHVASAPVVRHPPGGGAPVVGVITVARTMDPGAVREIAARTGLEIALVPAGAAPPAPFADADLAAVEQPLFDEADAGARPTVGQEVASRDFFLRAAWLPLDAGRVNVLVARRRSDLDAGLAAFQRATLLAVAGSTLVFVPLGGWLLRRAVSGRLERLAAGVEALQRNPAARLAPDGRDDEVARVVRAVNGLAAGFAAREGQLRASLDHHRALFDDAPVALVSVRASDGRLLRFNRAFERLLGYGADELGRLRIVDLYAQTPYGAPAAHRVYARFRAGEPVRGAELQMRRRDGRPLWVSLTTEPVRDAAGDVVEGHTAVVDIDSRKNGAHPAPPDPPGG